MLVWTINLQKYDPSNTFLLRYSFVQISRLFWQALLKFSNQDSIINQIKRIFYQKVFSSQHCVGDLMTLKKWKFSSLCVVKKELGTLFEVGRRLWSQKAFCKRQYRVCGLQILVMADLMACHEICRIKIVLSWFLWSLWVSSIDIGKSIIWTVNLIHILH